MGLWYLGEGVLNIEEVIMLGFRSEVLQEGTSSMKGQRLKP